MENLNNFISYMRLLVLCACLGIGPAAFAQDKVDQVVESGIQRNQDAKASQQRIDKIADTTEKLFAEYKKELKVIDGLKVYNTLLQKQLDDQVAQVNDLKDSIAEVSVIERQISPLMLRMIDGLEQFIKGDVPFLLKERTERVAKLRETVERADVTAAEKFRSVLEAYQIEGDYGRTIEAYKDLIDIDGKTRDASFLRFGRVALVYQTDDKEFNGVWDQANHKWQALNAAEYRNYFANGLKIARKQVAPDLVMLPVSAPTAATEDK